MSFSNTRFVRLFLVNVFIFFFTIANAQTFVSGVVLDNNQKPLLAVNVICIETNKNAVTDVNGNFKLEVPAQTIFTLSFSHLGNEVKTISLGPLQPGQIILENIVLKQTSHVIDSVVVTDKENREQAGMSTIDTKKAGTMPNVNGGVENYLKLLGAQSNNELSDQYSVHGGNFDENLVYVNGFEVYRPFLVSSAQQEGLSFVNPDLVGSLQFSTGGFQAKYGDKLSSVLDVTYKRPTQFKGGISLSLLGGSAYLEGASHNSKFTYLVGMRQKSNAYILNSLNTVGNYKPSFTDAQAYFTYKISPKSELDALFYGSRNVYQFVPDSQTTSFGLFSEAFQLQTFYEGQEIDSYNSAMGGLGYTYKPNEHLRLNWKASAYGSQEDETFDITGQYFIGELDNSLGSKTFGQIIYAAGVGTQQQFGRDFLDATVANIEHTGSYIAGKHFLEWGIKAQREIINDRLDEWNRLDSGFYTVPYDTSQINFQNVIKSQNNLNSWRYSGYIQDSYILSDARDILLNAGARFTYWTVDKQFLVSPRLQLSYKPLWKHDVVFRAAIGEYDQPPFYRELRNQDGIVNDSVLAQRSVHFVLGADYNFKAFDNTPFKLVAEAYYKYLWDVNPYDLQNERITYYATNDAKGFAEGIDLRLNGEIVKDAESWISVSVLNTQEDILNAYYYRIDSVGLKPDQTIIFDTTKLSPGYQRRPSDQRVTFAMFFQDYIPNHPNFKVHLSAVYGSGLPFGPPSNVQYRDFTSMPPYRRVDIGFSALLSDNTKPHDHFKLMNKINSLWASLEVFNLLDVSNTVSYQWVKAQIPVNGVPTNVYFSVPNYLTGRRINLRLEAKF